MADGSAGVEPAAAGQRAEMVRHVALWAIACVVVPASVALLHGLKAPGPGDSQSSRVFNGAFGRGELLLVSFALSVLSMTEILRSGPTFAAAKMMCGILVGIAIAISMTFYVDLVGLSVPAPDPVGTSLLSLVVTALVGSAAVCLCFRSRPRGSGLQPSKGAKE